MKTPNKTQTNHNPTHKRLLNPSHQVNNRMLKELCTWMSILTMLCITFQGNISYAKQTDTSNPIGCEHTGYQFNYMMLSLTPRDNGPDQGMYFFYNFSPEPVRLNQMHHHNSVRSVYKNHTILPYRWSVLSASEQNMRFMCSITNDQSEYRKVVDCKKVIKVCQDTKVRFGLNNKGNLWFVRNTTKNDALRQVVKFGIIP